MSKTIMKQVARAILYGYTEDGQYAYKLFDTGVFRILLTDFDSINFTTDRSAWSLVLELTA